MLKISQSIRELVPYPPGKPKEELQRELGIEKSFKLASNESPLPPSPKAVAAITDALGELNRYPDGSCYYLKENLAELLGVAASNLILVNGSNELIQLLAAVLLAPGDEVVMSEPTFLMYSIAVKGLAGVPVRVPQKENRHDLSGLLRAISDKTRAVFLDNPLNPTGQIIPGGELRSFLAELPEDVVLLLDEAYGDFVEDEGFMSGLELFRGYPNLVVARTFSKAYGLAGLRVAYGVAGEEIIDYLNRVRQPFNVNSLAQKGALAAIQDQKYLEMTLTLISREKRRLYAEIENLGLEYIPSETNFFLIDLKREAEPVFESLLMKGVIVRSMKSYGLSEYIRITVGTEEENSSFITALAEVLETG
jgi:histidinol-phosphate aminotransferase